MLSLRTDIRNWIRNIEQHASDNVNKILVGNKADMDESKRVILFIYPSVFQSVHKIIGFGTDSRVPIIGCSHLKGSSSG